MNNSKHEILYTASGDKVFISKEDHLYLVAFSLFSNKHSVRVYISGKLEFLHRVIAKRMGLDLSNDIDHIDRNPYNNTRENLRAATRSENLRNSKTRSNNSVGLKGVRRKGNKYEAHISLNGKYVHLGTFSSPEEAHEAYCKYARVKAKKFFNSGKENASN